MADAEPIPLSLDGLLGTLESEALFRLRDHLRDLSAMPGWVTLQELVAAQRERSSRIAEQVHRWQPRGLDGLIRHQAAEGHSAGYLKGMEEMASVVERVERLAARLDQALELQAD